MPSRSSTDDRSKALEKLVEKLTEARKSKVPRLTQAELAGKLKKSHQSAVAKIEIGEHELRLADFVRWARAVDEDPCELLREFEENLAEEERRRNRVLLRRPRTESPPQEVQPGRQPRVRKPLSRAKR